MRKNFSFFVPERCEQRLPAVGLPMEFDHEFNQFGLRRQRAEDRRFVLGPRGTEDGGAEELGFVESPCSIKGVEKNLSVPWADFG